MAKIDMPAQYVSTEGKKKKKIETKDLIQSGAFAAIYIVLMLIIVTGTSLVSPLLYLMAPLFVGIFTGTVYTLSILKVRSFVPALVMGLLFAVVAASTTIPSFLVVLFWTAVACLILIIGKFKSKLVLSLSFIAFNMTMTGPFFMLFYARDSFIEMCVQYNGQAWADAFIAVAPDWIYFAIMGFGLVGGILGSLIANAIVKKHFKKAGIV